MRKAVLLVLGILGGVGGCSSREAPVKRYIADVTDMVGGLKQIKRFDSIPKIKFVFAPAGTKPDEFERKFQDDVQALKDLDARLSEEERLQLQLKYGPVLDGLFVQMDAELMRIIAASKQGGGGGNAGIGNAMKAANPSFLLDGYKTMSKTVVSDLQQLISTCNGVTNPAQVDGALSAARQQRYRLAVDAVRLKHLEPRDSASRAKEQATLKGSLPGLLGSLRGAEEQVRRFPGGSDVVSAIEPLPAAITSLAAGG
jgi:hypothetical protein